MLLGWVFGFAGRVCCLFAHLALFPSIYHVKNQLECVALITSLAFAGPRRVVHSCEQVNAVGSFPSESFFIRNHDMARTTFSILHPGFGISSVRRFGPSSVSEWGFKITSQVDFDLFCGVISRAPAQPWQGWGGGMGLTPKGNWVQCLTRHV